MQTDYIRSLNALRGFAALFVLFLHVRSTLLESPIGATLPFETPLISRAYLAVDFFFVLSGFILMHVYHTQFKTVGMENYRQFIRNRLARIYPIHLLVLCFMMVWKALADQHVLPQFPVVQHGTLQTGWFDVLTNLLLIQAWHLQYHLSWNFPAWSVSSEFFTYLMAPWLIAGYAAAKGPLKRVGLYLLPVIGLVILIACFNGIAPTYREFGNLRMLFEFCLGLSVYRVYQDLRQSTLRLPYEGLFGLSVLAFFGTLFGNGPDLWLIHLNALMILCCALSSRGIARFLPSRSMFYFGEISFSMYMIHVPVINLFLLAFPLSNKTLGTNQYLWILAACGGITIFLAHLLYRYVEIPCRNALRGSSATLPAIPQATAPAEG